MSIARMVCLAKPPLLLQPPASMACVPLTINNASRSGVTVSLSLWTYSQSSCTCTSQNCVNSDAYGIVSTSKLCRILKCSRWYHVMLEPLSVLVNEFHIFLIFITYFKSTFFFTICWQMLKWLTANVGDTTSKGQRLATAEEMKMVQLSPAQRRQ